MKTFFKFFFGIFAFLLILLIGMLYTVDVNRYKYLFEEQLSQFWGVNIALQGPMKIHFFPLPHVNLSDVRIEIDLKKNQSIYLTLADLYLEMSWDSLYKEKKTIKALKAKDITLNYIENKNVLVKTKIKSIAAQIITSYQHMQIPSFEAIGDKFTLKGNLVVDFDNEIIKITGKMNSPQYQLLNTEQNTWDFFKEFFFFTELPNIQAKFTLNIDKVQLEDKAFEKVKLLVNLKNKQLLVNYDTKLAKILYSGKATFKKNASRGQMLTEFKILDPDKKNNVTGNLTFSFDAQTPYITGTIATNEVIFPTLEKNPSGRLFSSEVIGKLPELQGNIQFTVDKLHWQEITLDQVQAHVEFKPQILDAKVQGQLQGGQLLSRILLKQPQKNGPLSILADMRLNNAIASNVIKLFEEKALLLDGNLAFAFQGNTQGNSVASWMANLSGKALLHITHLKLMNQNIDSRYVNAFAALLKAFQTKEKETVLNCVVLGLNIKNGIAKANQSFALETKDIYALGTGSLNLRTETLDFAFDLHPRSELNIEVGALDNVVYLQGTLKDMKLVSSPSGMIREGSTIALGIATGGISLLAEKLYKIATKRASPCREILQASELNK